MRSHVWISAVLAVAACSSPPSAPAEAVDSGAALGAAPQAKTCAGSTARIASPMFPSRSVIVYVEDAVADFGADPKGVDDSTTAVQNALNAAAALGGGTVWLPAGRYRFEGPLVMPPTVTLRGDWKQPSPSDSAVGGTVLAIDYTAGPFMTFTIDASVDGMTFWYPKQSLASPLHVTAIAFSSLPKATAESITIANVTFVNPWIAIDTVAQTTDTGGNHVIENVYGAALNAGLVLRKTSSVSHAEDIHLGAEYWSQSGLPDAPGKGQVTAFTGVHATGITYRDNWGSYDITIDDFATGILFEGSDEDKTVTGQLTFGLEIHGANRAVDIESGNNFYVSNANLDATVGSNPAAIHVGSGLGKASLVLNEVELASTGVAIDDESPTYTVDVSQTRFDSWHGYAIAIAGADCIVAGSTFAQPAAGSKDLSLGASTNHAIIIGSTFVGGLSMDSQVAAKNHIYINDDSLALVPSGYGTHVDVPAPPQPEHAGPGSLYDASCYGATPDCPSLAFDSAGTMIGHCTDNTGAIQAALDDAGSNGGGTVYLPATPASQTTTYYVGGHLSVPPGVELLGPDADKAFRMTDAHAMLVAHGDSSPLITLGANAGVRGLIVWYANQNGYHPQPFAAAVQAGGPGDWVINLVLPNATGGVDFSTIGSSGHYISQYASQGYGNKLTISKSTSGFVGDLETSGGGGNKGSVLDAPMNQNNPVGDLYGPLTSGSAGGPDGIPDTCVGQVADMYAHDAGIVLGSAKNELVLNGYVHAPHLGLQAISDGAGGGPSFTLIHYGSETFTGLDLEALDPAGGKVLLSEYHTIAIDGYPQNGGNPIVGKPYIVIGDGVTPTTPLTVLTLANHSSTPIGLQLAGGKTRIQLYFSDQDGNGAAPVAAAVAVTGAKTGLAMYGGKFINDLSPGFGVTNADGSPNVAFGGMSMATALTTQGLVDLSFQPPFP